MFIKDIEKFKKTVEDTMWAFFKFTPQQVEDNIKTIEAMYSSKYKLDTIDFKYVNPETREIILRYRTLKYFDSVYKKTMELYDFLKIGDTDGC